MEVYWEEGSFEGSSVGEEEPVEEFHGPKDFFVFGVVGSEQSCPMYWCTFGFFASFFLFFATGCARLGFCIVGKCGVGHESDQGGDEGLCRQVSGREQEGYLVYVALSEELALCADFLFVFVLIFVLSAS